MRGAHAAVLAVVALLAAVVGTGAPAPAQLGGQRYLDAVFDDTEVTSDIVYTSEIDYQGHLVDLELDIHQPAGDLMPERPVLVWMHGGGFTGGDKAQGRATEMATEFARRGFVVASINYRVDPTAPGSLATILTDPTFLGAVLKAYADARTAVAWLRDHAREYRIDPDAVFAAGYSAGAVLALMMEALPDITAPGALTDPSRISGALSVAGTMLALPGVVQPGEPPVYMAHGDHDPRVPYASAVQFCDALLVAGNLCDLFTMPNTQHNPSAFHEEIREQASAFFFTNVLEPLGYTTAVAPPPTPTTTTTTLPGDPAEPAPADSGGTGATDDAPSSTSASAANGAARSLTAPASPVARSTPVAPTYAG